MGRGRYKTQVAAELRVAARRLGETTELMDARLAAKSDCRGVLKLTCIRANLDQVSGDCDPYVEVQYLTKEAARAVTPEGPVRVDEGPHGRSIHWVHQRQVRGRTPESEALAPRTG